MIFELESAGNVVLMATLKVILVQNCSFVNVLQKGRTPVKFARLYAIHVSNATTIWSSIVRTKWWIRRENSEKIPRWNMIRLESQPQTRESHNRSWVCGAWSSYTITIWIKVVLKKKMKCQWFILRWCSSTLFLQIRYLANTSYSRCRQSLHPIPIVLAIQFSQLSSFVFRGVWRKCDAIVWSEHNAQMWILMHLPCVWQNSKQAFH